MQQPTYTTVEEFAKSLTPEMHAHWSALRAIVRRVMPDDPEVISYGMPTLKRNKRPMVYYGAFKAHVSLFFGGSRVYHIFKGEIKPYLVGKSAIQFKLGEPLPEKLIEQLLTCRLEEFAETRK